MEGGNTIELYNTDIKRKYKNTRYSKKNKKIIIQRK